MMKQENQSIVANVKLRIVFMERELHIVLNVANFHVNS